MSKGVTMSTLPLESLPERLVPPQKATPRTSWRSPARRSGRLTGVTGRLTRRMSLRGFSKPSSGTTMPHRARKCFRFPSSPILRDRKTEISLETKAHARQYIERSAEWFRERSLSAEAEKLEIAGYDN